MDAQVKPVVEDALSQLFTPLNITIPRGVNRELIPHLESALSTANAKRNHHLTETYRPTRTILEIDKTATEIHNTVLDSIVASSSSSPSLYIDTCPEIVDLITLLSDASTGGAMQLDEHPHSSIINYVRLVLESSNEPQLKLLLDKYITCQAETEYVKHSADLIDFVRSGLRLGRLKVQIEKLTTAFDKKKDDD